MPPVPGEGSVREGDSAAAGICLAGEVSSLGPSAASSSASIPSISAARRPCQPARRETSRPNALPRCPWKRGLRPQGVADGDCEAVGAGGGVATGVGTGVATSVAAGDGDGVAVGEGDGGGVAGEGEGAGVFAGEGAGREVDGCGTGVVEALGDGDGLGDGLGEGEALAAVC